MKKPLVVGRQIFKGCLRAKSMSLIAFYIVALIIFMAMISGSDSAFRTALVIDSGLSLINIFALLLVGLIILPIYQSEKDRHTLAAALACDISRSQYLWGLWLGSSGALVVNYLIMSVILLINLVILQVPVESGVFRQLYLNLCELLCLGSFAVALSVFFSYVVAAMLTVSLYIVGHLTTSLQMALQEWENSWIGTVLGWVRMIIPDLSLFNLKDIVIKSSDIPFTYDLTAFVYAAAMIIIAIEMARYKLNRENLT